MTANAQSSASLPLDFYGAFKPAYQKFYEGQKHPSALSPSQLAAQKATDISGVKISEQQQAARSFGRQTSEATQYPVALMATQEGADQFSQALQALSGQAAAQMSPYTSLGAQAANQWASLLGLQTAPLTAQEQTIAQQNAMTSQLGNIQNSLATLGETTDPAERARLMGVINQDISNVQGMAGDSPIGAQLGEVQQNMSRDLGPSSIQQALEATPGYQFRYEQGIKAVEQSLAGRGLRKSGQALKELTEYGQGMASQEYGNLLDRYAQAAGFGSQLQAGVQQLQTGLGTRGAEAQMQAGQEFRRGPASMHSKSQAVRGSVSSGSSKGGGLSF